MSPHPTRTASALRRFRRPIYALILLLALYWVPAHAVFWSGLIGSLASEEDGGFTVNHGFAVTPFPGVAWIWGVRLRGTDPNVHWQVDLARSRMLFSIPALLQKKLVVHSIRVSNATVEIQEHGLPPEKFKKDPWADGPQSWPWEIHVKSVSIANLRQARMNSVRVVSRIADSPVKGELLLIPGRLLRIRGSSWQMHAAEVYSGDFRAITGLNGEAKVESKDAPLAMIGGNEVLRWFDVELALQAQVENARPLAPLLGAYRSLQFGQSMGRIEASIRAKDGILLDGSSIRAEFDNLFFDLSQSGLSGRGSLRWEIQNRALDLGLELDDVRWQSFHPGPLVSGGRLTLIGQSHLIDLVSPFRDLALDFKLAKARVLGLSYLMETLDRDTFSKGERTIHSSGDELSIEGRINTSTKSFDGKIRYFAPNLIWRRSKSNVRLETQANVETIASSKNYEQAEFSLAGAKVQLLGAKIRDGSETLYERDEWDLGVFFKRSRISFSPVFELDTRLELRMEDLKVPIRFLLPEKKLLQFALSIFPLSDFRGIGDFSIGKSGIRFGDFRADSKQGSIRASLVKDTGKSWAGGILMELTPLTACLQLDDNGLEFHGNQPRERCAQSWKGLRRP